jgi:hypothetical protein
MSEARVLRPMLMGARDCEACAGTGEPSPWEYDHHLWLRGQPIAVCGACHGAGMVSKWGFRLSARKVLEGHRRMNETLFGGSHVG